jgi:signal peptidase
MDKPNVKFTKKNLGLLFLAVVALGIILLPVYARTGSYPLAIVDGNSMYPNLQNGDMIYYHAATNNANIPNGTVIVFVQGDTGISLLDGLVRPVVIHRIVGEITQGDGQICYETKGDNNNVNDPFLTRSDHVLGVAGQYIPKVGLLILFLKSPQGLIATIGIITLACLSMFDIRRRQEKNKDKLLGALAKKVLNGYLSDEQFKKLELAVKYSDEFESESVKDRSVFALVDWLKNGALDENWKMKMIICPKCFHIAVGIEAKNESVTICSNCNEVRAWNTTLTLTKESLNTILLISIDEALSSLGKDAKETLYRHLKRDFALKKNEIPRRLDDFSVAIDKIFGDDTFKINLLLLNIFKKNLLLSSRVDPQGPCLQDFVQQVKENIEQKDKLTKIEDKISMKVVDTKPTLRCEIHDKSCVELRQHILQEKESLTQRTRKDN